jgi:germination protein M
LYRAAVVKMLEQIDGVDFIQFYVDGQPLTDQNEKVIGFMSDDNFIDNTGKETNYGQNVSMVLYFANEDGTKLKEVHVSKVYDGTITIEQLIIQQLLEGVASIDGLDEDYYDTIPDGTNLIKTTTKDGICYVDFNSNFLNKRKGLTDETAIYSVVNSLVELSSVNKVQFTIDGVQVDKYGDGTDFSDIFERNLDIVE